MCQQEAVTEESLHFLSYIFSVDLQRIFSPPQYLDNIISYVL